MSVWKIIGEVSLKIESDSAAKVDIKNKDSEYQTDIIELSKQIMHCQQKMDATVAFDKYILAMYAVAFSVANCDGEVQPEEMKEIDCFIIGKTYNNLSDYMKSRIHYFKNFPPTFNAAMCYVKRLNKQSWGIFDKVIEIAMRENKFVRLQENSFRNAWQKFKIAA